MNSSPESTNNPAESLTVSLVVRDARGFTHHYEDMSTTAQGFRDALDVLVSGEREKAAKSATPKDALDAGANHE